MAVQYRLGGEIYGTLNVYGGLTINGVNVSPAPAGLAFVSAPSGFPAPVNGIIQLENNRAYGITSTIDLSGARLVGGTNTCLFGSSSDISKITSSGLNPSMPLLSSNYGCTIREVTFFGNTKHLDLNGAADPLGAAVILGSNFQNTSSIGTIKNYNNVLFESGAFLNAGGLIFDGTFGTGSVFQCACVPYPNTTMFTVLSTATFTRRFRVFYSGLILASGTTGINAMTAATIPNEGLIYDNLSFSGAGTYITGINETSNRAAFQDCTGISNTWSVGHLYMANNLSPTIIPNTTNFFKMSGTADIGSFANRFTNGNSRLTYVGSLDRLFLVGAIASVTSGNNNVVYVGIAKNGTVLPFSTIPTTTSGSGRSENVKTQTYVRLLSGDYIELFVRNSTGANNITVTDLNIGVEAL